MPTTTKYFDGMEGASCTPPALCRICCDLADGHHFGAAACRACAAFFRRTVKLNRTHECSKTNQCFISTNVRNMCRSCRYDKCLDVGMKRSAVQQKRDQLGKRESMRRVSEGCTTRRGKLHAMKEAYEQLLMARKTVHNRRENQEPRAISFNELQDVYLKEMAIVYQFLCESFPEYSDLLPDTKRSLFKNFFLPFTLVESSFNGARQHHMMMIPSGDYIDLEHMESYFNRDHREFTQEDTISMFAQQYKLIQTCITFPLSAENVDVYEFLALSAIILWESDLESETDRKNIQDEAAQMRAAIVQDLLFYYQSMNVYDDVALRLGTILSILPSIQRACHRFHEYMHIKNLLNLYALPQNLYDMFSPVS